MSFSRIALGGLLALGFVGLSAGAAQAQHHHGGYAPRPSYGYSPYYAPVYTPPVVVVRPPVVTLQPSYGYYNPGYVPYRPSHGYGGTTFGYSGPGYSFGFSFGNYFR